MRKWQQCTVLPVETLTYKRQQIENKIFCFDIETTSFFKKNGEWVTAKDCDPDALSSCPEKLCIPYIWQLGINNKVYYGRSLREFYIFCRDCLNKFYPAKKIIWVHNLSYEYAFLAQDFRFSKVFSRRKGDIIYCYSKELNIEFRCTYKLTVMKLANIPGSFDWVNVTKAVGDLDYDLPRLPNTPLTWQEQDYCDRDIRVMYQYIHGLMEFGGYSCVADIPLTQTGMIRRIIKTKVLNSSSHLRHMEAIKPNLQDYRLLTRVMRGAVTQCQWTCIDVLKRNVFHIDIESSYPFVMCTKYYPCSKWEYGNDNFHDDRYLYIYTLELYDVEQKSPWTYICYSKTEQVIPRDGETLFDAVAEGKVTAAKKIVLKCTDVDLEIIKKVYNIGEIRYIDYARSKKGMLPLPLIKYILSLYKEKTEIKGIKKLAAKYAFLKQQLNGIYGMILTNIYKDEPIDLGFNFWDVDEMTDAKLEKALAKTKPFLNYSWGIYVTAYARQSLFDLIMKFPVESLYCDTDSIFFVNETNFKIVEEINLQRYKELENVSIRLEIPLEYFIPTDKGGKRHALGSWSREPDLEYFKSVGSKKYCMKEKDGKFSVVIAGCQKKYFDFKLNKEVPTVPNIDSFYLDIDNPARFKNGRTVFWNVHCQPPVVLTDYLGNQYKNDQLCGLVCLKTYYTLGITPTLNDFCALEHNGYTNPYRYKY